MIGLQQYSFSGIFSAQANIRRRLYGEEEKESRELERTGASRAGGLDRKRPRSGPPVVPCAHPTLKADEGADAPSQAWPDVKIADAFEVSRSTVARVRERFAREGLEAALVHRRPKNTKPRKLDGLQEAHLIALACSEPPKGKKRWSVRLLAERFVELECAEEPISRELVRRTLSKVNSSPG